MSTHLMEEALHAYMAKDYPCINKNKLWDYATMVLLNLFKYMKKF